MNVNTLIIESKTTTILERKKKQIRIPLPRAKLKYFGISVLIILNLRNSKHHTKGLFLLESGALQVVFGACHTGAT